MKTAQTEYHCNICGTSSLVPSTPEDPTSNVEEFEGMFNAMFNALACDRCSEWRTATRRLIEAIVNKSFRLKDGAGESELNLRESLRKNVAAFLEVQYTMFGRVVSNVLDRLVESCVADPPRSKFTLLRALNDISKESNLPNARDIVARGRIS